jgi:hypothetical protein
MFIQTLARRSLTLHSTPFASLPLPLIARAPSFRFGPNPSLAPDHKDNDQQDNKMTYSPSKD